jgi:hypothetical protein
MKHTHRMTERDSREYAVNDAFDVEHFQRVSGVEVLSEVCFDQLKDQKEFGLLVDVVHIQ